MTSPDAREHIALRYLRIGASVIPLQRRDKRPFLHVLENGEWKPYQQRMPRPDEVGLWIERGTENWGIICGVVSGRLYCGDVDDVDMAHWVLDNASHPVFRGAAIVESGSGKAHIWFRSQTKLFSGVWYLTNRAAHAGDIRGDGRGAAGPSYMVVPPSIHPTGLPYRMRAGSFGVLPDVPDGAAFLKAVGDAYLAERPTAGGKQMHSNDKDILVLNDVEKADVLSGIRTLGLKKKILDTLTVPGNQTPGTRHWSPATTPSTSEIDFAVVAELVRKGLDFPAVERIYACSEIGGYTYREKKRPNHGYGYLKYTYDNAREKIEKERQAARVASGNNFRVLRVTVTHFGPREDEYHVEIETVPQTATEQPVRMTVDIRGDELLTEQSFTKAVSLSTRWMPKLAPNQRGRNFGDFASALMQMVEDVVQAPREASEAGHMATIIAAMLAPMVERPMPTDLGSMPTLGWLTQGEHYLRMGPLLQQLRGHFHPLNRALTLKALGMLGNVTHEVYTFGDSTEPQSLLKLILKTQGRPHLQLVPTQPALPPPSA